MELTIEKTDKVLIEAIEDYDYQLVKTYTLTVIGTVPVLKNSTTKTKYKFKGGWYDVVMWLIRNNIKPSNVEGINLIPPYYYNMLDNKTLELSAINYGHIINSNVISE